MCEWSERISIVKVTFFPICCALSRPGGSLVSQVCWGFLWPSGKESKPSPCGVPQTFSIGFSYEHIYIDHQANDWTHFICNRILPWSTAFDMESDILYNVCIFIFWCLPLCLQVWMICHMWGLAEGRCCPCVWTSLADSPACTVETAYRMAPALAPPPLR